MATFLWRMDHAYVCSDQGKSADIDRGNMGLLCTATTMKSRVPWSRQISPFHGVFGSTWLYITRDRYLTIVLYLYSSDPRLKFHKIDKFFLKIVRYVCLPEIFVNGKWRPYAAFSYWLRDLHRAVRVSHWRGYCISQSHDIIIQWPPLTDWNLPPKCKILQNYDCIKILTYKNLSNVAVFSMCTHYFTIFRENCGSFWPTETSNQHKEI